MEGEGRVGLRGCIYCWPLSASSFSSRLLSFFTDTCHEVVK